MPYPATAMAVEKIEERMQRLASNSLSGAFERGASTNITGSVFDFLKLKLAGPLVTCANGRAPIALQAG
jgi:hypothetical protein